MATAPVRRMALIDPLGDRRVAVHTAGFPLNPDAMLPPADVVLLISDGKSAGDTMLFRYSAHGELCGDTPHDSVNEAEEQATREFGEALHEWLAIPDEIKDAHAFAVAFAADQLRQRD